MQTTPKTLFRNLAITVTRECNKAEPDWMTLLKVVKQTCGLIEVELAEPKPAQSVPVSQ